MGLFSRKINTSVTQADVEKLTFRKATGFIVGTQLQRFADVALPKCAFCGAEKSFACANISRPVFPMGCAVIYFFRCERCGAILYTVYSSASTEFDPPFMKNPHPKDPSTFMTVWNAGNGGKGSELVGKELSVAELNALLNDNKEEVL